MKNFISTLTYMFTIILGFAQDGNITLEFVPLPSVEEEVTITLSSLPLNIFDAEESIVVQPGNTLTVNYAVPNNLDPMIVTASWECDGENNFWTMMFASNDGEYIDGYWVTDVGCDGNPLSWDCPELMGDVGMPCQDGWGIINEACDCIEITDDCGFSLEVTETDDGSTFEVVTDSGANGIYEWYVDGELVPPSTETGGLIWNNSYETICVTMYSLEGCIALPLTECHSSGNSFPWLDGLDFGELLNCITELCNDDPEMCYLLDTLFLAWSGDVEASYEIVAFVDAGGCGGDVPCDINYEVMQAWDAGGNLLPNELWVWIYDFDSEYNYVFDFGDESTPTTEGSHTYEGNGPYDFCITVSSDEDDCSSTYCESIAIDDFGMYQGITTGFTINVMGMGASNVDPIASWSKSLQVFPNPTTNGEVRLQWDSANRDILSNEYAVEIYTLSGTQIESGISNLNVENTQMTMQLEGLSPGIYFIKLLRGNEWATKKLIIH